MDDELIREEAIAMAELEERMIKIRERRDYDEELDEEVFIPAPRQCAENDIITEFFSKHTFVGEVSHSYLDW